ncbi:MAG: hypothetical protein MSP08_09070 [Clostridiales bacterium]|nr:hypothetical protein [Clostridiales bacterium]
MMDVVVFLNAQKGRVLFEDAEPDEIILNLLAQRLERNAQGDKGKGDHVGPFGKDPEQLLILSKNAVSVVIYPENAGMEHDAAAARVLLGTGNHPVDLPEPAEHFLIPLDFMLEVGLLFDQSFVSFV